VFSFHPLQTFPRDFDPRRIIGSVEGIYYGVDGSEKGVRTARTLARMLGGRILLVPPEMREFYHASCVVASNHLTSLLWVLQRMYRMMDSREGDCFGVFRPIIEATLRNVAASSPAAALSGPVARGGVETVAGHLKALRKYLPEEIPYFLTMTEETMRLALRKGSITPGQAVQMTDLVESYRNHPNMTQEVR
jgi:predicted short-subunit dehydrogenase-like oxidoreductase (DUF2520 family)